MKRSDLTPAQQHALDQVGELYPHPYRHSNGLVRRAHHSALRVLDRLGLIESVWCEFETGRKRYGFRAWIVTDRGLALARGEEVAEVSHG